MNRHTFFLIATVIAGGMLSSTPVSAQCGNCQPGVKAGFTPGSPLQIYLDPSLSAREVSAAQDALANWNAWFASNCATEPFTFTASPGRANVTIAQDPQLAGTGIAGSTNSQTLAITTNPDYAGQSDGFLPDVLGHEFGHAMGFTDVYGGCQGQSIMYGNITVGGPYTTAPTAVDQCSMAQAQPKSTAPTDAYATCDPAWGCAEPIIITMEKGGYRLAGLADPVSFDIFAVGRGKVTLGWTARDSETAFLAYDRNGNGMIDNGGELFGNGTLLRDGSHAANGFVALAQYDTNGDGVIDASDEIWKSLLLWTDRNHDGVSQPSELQPLASSSITAIELEHHWVGRRDTSGNAFGFEGHIHEGLRTLTIYDVFFVLPH